MKTKKDYILIFFVIILFLFPWINSDFEPDTLIPEVSQENISFYEIYPCKVSFFEFLKANPKSSYQNHYSFKPNNKTPISCFGKISGVYVQQNNEGTRFIISVGISSFLNLFLQGLLWIWIFSFIPKNKKNSYFKKKDFHLVTILAAILFTFSIHAENRFYDNSFYLFDFLEIKSYFLIFFIFYFLLFNISDLYITRSESFYNYLPFAVVFTCIFSGFNLSFHLILFVYLGLFQIFKEPIKKIYKYSLVFFIFWWLFNSHGQYFFNVSKFRGFTSSSYSFNSNLIWITFFILLVLGVSKMYSDTRNYFKFEEFVSNVSRASIITLVFGYLGANLPLFNFLGYLFFGLQRNIVEQINPFAFDEFSVKISWRGMFPSAETIGEIYGLALIFILFYILRGGKLNNLHKIGILTSGLGLYFSDNRTAIVLVFLITFASLFFMRLNKLVKKSYIPYLFFALLTFLVILFAIGSSNYQTSYIYISNNLVGNAQTYVSDSNIPSFLNYIIISSSKNSFFSYIFGFFSAIAYLLNRGEMWGLFFARYNPTFMELLFGSGPLTFGQLYGEITITKSEEFLLPHSSFLSLLVFIGIVPLMYLFVRLIKLLVENKDNREFLVIMVFILINTFKNDSINYLSIFIYYCLVSLIFKKHVSTS